MAKKLKGDALLDACAEKFAVAVSNANDSSGFVLDACAAAVEWFGKVEAGTKQLSAFADRVCDFAGISEDVDKRKSPRSRYRKIARTRLELPGMIAGIKTDKRYDGKFSLHEGLKVATIVKADPKISVTKCVNAYFAKKAAGDSKSLEAKLQDICTKVIELKGVRKGTPNGKLVAALIASFEAAEYNVE